MSRIRRHRQACTPMITIQSTLLTAPDLCKNVLLAVLIASRGDFYTVCTQSHMYMYTLIFHSIETVLQGMIDKLIEIGSCYGMEMNVEKTKVIRISRQPSPVTITIDQKQLENVEYFKYLGSMLTNDGRCTREIKSRIAMA